MSKSKEQFIKQRELEQRLEDVDYQYEQYLKQLYLNNLKTKTWQLMQQAQVKTKGN